MKPKREFNVKKTFRKTKRKRVLGQINNSAVTVPGTGVPIKLILEFTDNGLSLPVLLM